MKDEVVEMFYHTYDSYMVWAVQARPQARKRPVSKFDCAKDHRAFNNFNNLNTNLVSELPHPYSMEHAFPLDELRPLSCTGVDTLGSYALTLIDSLDTIALMGNHTEFARGVKWVSENVRFDIDKTVSLFETNIRILGGLLAAHLLASDPKTGMAVEGRAPPHTGSCDYSRD